MVKIQRGFENTGLNLISQILAPGCGQDLFCIIFTAFLHLHTYEEKYGGYI